jgi:nucleotide-binding universal stress UspA family protein
MAARLTKSGITVESGVMVGEVNTEIKRAISAYKPDLVAMGTHGRSGIQRWFIGSTTERLLRHCPVPLITTSMIRKPRPDATRFQRILVTTDFSDGTADALDYAFSIAQENQSAITLLHVIEAPPKSTVPNRKSLVSATLRNLAKLVPPESEAWCDVKTKAEMGTPYQVVLKVLQTGKFDLLVMNIHGKGMLERALLGSTAERVVRAARCPVMLIPPMRKTARRPRTRKTVA